jgi:Transposase Tn5 dimerisation domain
MVEFKPPKRKPHLGPIRIWAVTAVEVEVPAGQEPVEWRLLTTMEVKSLKQALEVIDWYTQRFQIEVFDRTLKSGCRIEDRQLGNAQGLEGCLAVDMAVAWRIVRLTKLGREVPEVPCMVFFEEAQWKALVVFATENPRVPEQPPTLRDAIRMMAMSLGGFLGRNGDKEPGAETIWRGQQRLDDITRMWVLLTEGQPWRSPTERELDSS